MKANEMPERVYLFDYNDAMVTPMEGDTVYVREDTFIEKTAQWLKENLLNHTYVYEGEVSIGMDVFLKEFKKAMKL